MDALYAWRRKAWVVMLVGIATVSIMAPPVDAGPFEKFKQTLGNTRNAVSNKAHQIERSIDNKARDTRESLSNRARETKQNIEQQYRDRADTAKDTLRDVGNRTRQRLNDEIARGRENAADAARRVGNAATDRSRTVLDSVRSGSRDQLQGIQGTTRRITGGGIASKLSRTEHEFSTTVANTIAGARQSFSRTVRSISSPDSDLQNVARTLKGTARNVFETKARNFNDRTRTVIAGFLSRTKEDGAQAVDRSADLLRKIETHVGDPDHQRRAVAAALVASGTALAVYQYKDDIQYLLLRTTMENVRVPTREGWKSADDAYRDFILSRAPYLADTQIANDPAALLAYGVVEVGKDDFIDYVPLIPDGHGGAVPVGRAIQQTENADEALGLLNMAASIEGMALDAAADGHLGRGPQQFAVAFQETDDAIGRRLSGP